MLLWKKAQKNDTKNNTSEAMNKTIPVFNPFITMLEWFPCVDPSRWISRHHENAIPRTNKKEININFMFTLFTKIRPERTSLRAPLDASKGQGLMSTKWKGLNLFINILLQLCIMWLMLWKRTLELQLQQIPVLLKLMVLVYRLEIVKVRCLLKHFLTMT